MSATLQLNELLACHEGKATNYWDILPVEMRTLIEHYAEEIKKREIAEYKDEAQKLKEQMDEVETLKVFDSSREEYFYDDGTGDGLCAPREPITGPEGELIHDGCATAILETLNPDRYNTLYDYLNRTYGYQRDYFDNIFAKKYAQLVKDLKKQEKQERFWTREMYEHIVDYETLCRSLAKDSVIIDETVQYGLNLLSENVYNTILLERTSSFKLRPSATDDDRLYAIRFQLRTLLEQVKEKEAVVSEYYRDEDCEIQDFDCKKLFEKAERSIDWFCDQPCGRTFLGDMTAEAPTESDWVLTFNY